MDFRPVADMWERIKLAKQDSDIAAFNAMLYLGEMLTKTVASALVSALEDDKDRHRYRQLHRLVRADSLGDWHSVLEDVITGPAAPCLTADARLEQSELTQRCGAGTWQYDACSLLNNCLKALKAPSEDLPTKADGGKWFAMFAELRNKTRGHGAPPGGVIAKIGSDLETSLHLLYENHNLFKRSWAYLHQNLSGKYRVTNLTEDAASYDVYRSTQSAAMSDGVYVYFDKAVRVELIKPDVDASDFFFPNGGFNGKTFEMLSYKTGNRVDEEASLYLAPVGALPQSKTHGLGTLDVQGCCFGNLPPIPSGYINRVQLERELYTRLSDDRHPVITLHGRGGIGKTSLALAVLHQIKDCDRFEASLWFSARDIDLLPHGPRLVGVQVLTEDDIAKEFVKLIGPNEAKEKGFKPRGYLAKALTTSPLGRPILFVFDNFETVRNPTDLYQWLDTHIRVPNKVLITTRFREFKGDFPVEVLGMTEQECEKLITAVASELCISSLITPEYTRLLHSESDGHPYVIKVLLGEVAKVGKMAKIERIIASKDDILEALFERTYSGLSPAAKRVFLTLCNWRSIIPQIALEAVMLRPSNEERMDIVEAIEELSRSSFIDILVSESDSEQLLWVPLVSAIFGEKKLAVSPMKAAIESDTKLLQSFGAARFSSGDKGISHRIEYLFQQVARNVISKKEELKEFHPILKFIAGKYPPARRLLSSLYEELGSSEWVGKAKETILWYLESPLSKGEQQWAWNKLMELGRATGDWALEVHAGVELCQLDDTPFKTLSNVANRMNGLFKQGQLVLETEEKRIILRKLTDVMDERIDEGDATDCSRLAWLLFRLKDEDSAKRITKKGLKLDPNNEYCRNLAKRLVVL